MKVKELPVEYFIGKFKCDCDDCVFSGIDHRKDAAQKSYVLRQLWKCQSIGCHANIKIIYSLMKRATGKLYWIGSHLFNDDTRPWGHISRPSQVGFSHRCLHYKRILVVMSSNGD